MRARLFARLPESPGQRWLLATLVAVVVVNLLLVLGTALQPKPSGPGNSSFATQPAGFAAWADLLRRNGHRVDRRRDALDEGRLDPASTLVVLDPERVEDEDIVAMGRFVRGGGRLVAGGERTSWLHDVVDEAPAWRSGGPRVARSAPGADLEPRVEAVRSSGAFWADTGRAELRLGTRDAPLLLEQPEGRGRALLLADTTPLQNRGLAQADNAALALALAGTEDRRVVFAESLQGFGSKSGIEAIPTRWRVALIGLGLAALLFLLARARRLGPAEPEPPEPTPARREHVEALGAALRDGGHAGAVAAPLRAAARARVAERAGLRPDAPDADIRAAALGLGWTETEADALSAAPGAKIDDDGLLAAGRALARTIEGGRR